MFHCCTTLWTGYLCFTGLTCSGCAPHSVHIVLGFVGNIVVDNQVYSGNIQTSERKKLPKIIHQLNHLNIMQKIKQLIFTTWRQVIYDKKYPHVFNCLVLYDNTSIFCNNIYITFLSDLTNYWYNKWVWYLLATSVAIRMLIWLDLNLARAANLSFWRIMECSTTHGSPSCVQTIPKICVYLQQLCWGCCIDILHHF